MDGMHLQKSRQRDQERRQIQLKWQSCLCCMWFRALDDHQKSEEHLDLVTEPAVVQQGDLVS